jgi:hypothetical protein
MSFMPYVGCINLVLDAMFWHNDEIKLIDIFEI